MKLCRSCEMCEVNILWSGAKKPDYRTSIARKRLGSYQFYSFLYTIRLWNTSERQPERHRDTHPRVEAESNTSTVTLRVVGGYEKGSLKSETVKYGRQSQGTRTRERLRWQGPAAYTKDRPVLSSERAPHKNKTVTVKE
jgi:hypothetical protein